MDYDTTTRRWVLKPHPNHRIRIDADGNAYIENRTPGATTDLPTGPNPVEPQGG
jgi:hypothetical protein